jgi:hypothetical protein
MATKYLAGLHKANVAMAPQSETPVILTLWQDGSETAVALTRDQATKLASLLLRGVVYDKEHSGSWWITSQD